MDGKQTILVELDALLDTRLATVSRIDEDAATRLLRPSYRNRKIDDFETLTNGVVTNEAFKKAYAERDADTLAKSLVTPAILLLHDIVKGLLKQQLDTPFADEITIQLNTHPYSLTEKEEDAFVTAVLAWLDVPGVSVEPVNLSLKELTPPYIKSTYSALIIYHLDDWLAIQRDSLKELRMPQVTIIAPAIYAVDVPSEDLFPENENGDKVDPFAILEYTMAEWVTLALQDVKMFSVMPLPTA